MKCNKSLQIHLQQIERKGIAARNDKILSMEGSKLKLLMNFSFMVSWVEFLNLKRQINLFTEQTEKEIRVLKEISNKRKSMLVTQNQIIEEKNIEIERLKMLLLRDS